MKADQTRKVTLDIPGKLYKETQQAVMEMNITTSMFIRKALEAYLASLLRAKLESELAAGYRETASLSDRVHQDFKFVDFEMDQRND
jgi:metal-responsive CopG/Arc/MetJ family transcriptional regulator